jgi:hypothetical protein
VLQGKSLQLSPKIGLKTVFKEKLEENFKLSLFGLIQVIQNVFEHHNFICNGPRREKSCFLFAILL